MLFQNKLPVSRSKVLQSFWSPLMTTKFWTNPRKKKTISDWSIKTFPSYESYFANQKNCEDIHLILTVHLPDLRVEMMRKKVYFDIKLRNHATMAFCSKISIFIQSLFFKDSYWIFQICKQPCCTTTKTTIYCTQAIYVMTNECFSRRVLNK